MDPALTDPYPGILLFSYVAPGAGSYLTLGIVFGLLLLSGLVSASEVAFFSLSPSQLKEIEEDEDPGNDKVLEILKKPKRLLATILIANNSVNVAIVILSTTLLNQLLNFEGDPAWLSFLVQIVGVTLLILLFGEIIPKVYASKNPLKVAVFMAGPMLVVRKIFWPFSGLLVSSSQLIDKRIKKKSTPITVDELGQALEITYAEEETSPEEKKILEGIVKFGSTDVKQIMKPRTDVVAFDIKTGFLELIARIIDSGFSRVPVFEDSIDQIKGILYIKDLLPYLNEGDDFNWQQLIREPFFVPENKKIDDLLKEIKDTRVHLAVVVDEYGGTSGIVTLEDIIEEIVGDITDEFDDEDITYSKLDENNYVFEGKTSLIDIYKVLEISGDEFEKVKGESDTLAGFVLERSGKILKKGDEVEFENYRFTIEAADQRRIKQIKLTLMKEDGEKKNENGFIGIWILLVFLTGLSSCNDPAPLPKPHGELRLELPEKKYAFFEDDCPFSFEVPVYSVLEDRSMGRPETYCFKNLHFPSLRGTLHLSYKALDNNVDRFIDECHRLAYEHTVKATSIDQEMVRNDSTKVYGLLYVIRGNAASPLQFYATDSLQHFIRGSFYFNVKPNYDSIRPVAEFVKQDIDHLLSTLKWK